MSLKITTKFKQWQTYRSDLRVFPDTAEGKFDDIQDKLRDYRVALAGIKHKPGDLDDAIYSSYLKIDGQILMLNQETNRRPLIINTRKRLEDLWLSWKDLLEQQSSLLNTLDTAPEEVKTYNDLQIQSEQDEIEQHKREKQLKEIESLRNSLDLAIKHIEKHGINGSNGSGGSEIIVFGESQPQWLTQLDLSTDPASLSLQGTEQVLDQYYRLREIIREAPVMAKAIKSLEEKYCQLKDTHESLMSLGKPLIQEEELARLAVMLYEQIPDLWTSGDFNQLDEMIERIDKSISYYQAEFDEILSVERVRRPGITNVLTLYPEERLTAYEDLILFARNLVSAVDARDRYMQGHSEMVTKYALDIARNLNWNQTELEQLELAGLLHDVGKLNVPEDILTKTGPLTTKEWSVIQIHPQQSAKIIRPVKRLYKIVPWVLYHQERWDGKGYPDHLTKKDIPLGSSIIALAEAYTAMTTRMPNRSALSKEEALENIKRESGKQFNPEVAEAFLDVLELSF